MREKDCGVDSSGGEIGPRSTALDIEKFAKAVRTVCSAISDFHGADCSMYALIGAEALREYGISAKAVAGSAAWRVGPGDGDMISHAPEMVQQMFAPEGAIKAGMFHSWIEVDVGSDSFIFDPTTFQLPTKAKVLDAADGGCTTVKFAPEFLWVRREVGTRMDFEAVAQYPDEGVYAYLRKQDIESIVLAKTMADNLAGYGGAVRKCYESLCAGHQVQVVGLGVDGVPSEVRPQRLYKPIKL